MSASLNELMSLSSRVAVVTGGAKGIGRAIALRLAELGAKVVVADLDEREGEQTTRLVREQGGTAAFVRCNVGLVEDARRLVDLAQQRFGVVDLVVNNAGIFPASPALDTPEELWDRVLDVNLKGAFFLAQEAARHMKEAGRGGVIVNVASVDALHPSGGLVHYDASKAGVVMMTRSLALELGPFGIRVVAVAPGGIHTPGADEATKAMTGGQAPPEAVTKAFEARIPLGRMGEPDDIATVVAFLASPAASYVTGATLTVDGGYLVG